MTGMNIPPVTTSSLTLRQYGSKWVVEKITTTTEAVHFDTPYEASDYLNSLLPPETSR